MYEKDPLSPHLNNDQWIVNASPPITRILEKSNNQSNGEEFKAQEWFKPLLLTFGHKQEYSDRQ